MLLLWGRRLGFLLLVESVEDVAVEGGDGGFVGGGIGRDGVGVEWSLVAWVSALGVVVELALPLLPERGVVELFMHLLGDIAEIGGVAFLSVGSRLVAGEAHDVGVGLAVAGAVDDAVGRGRAAGDGCERVSEKNFCHDCQRVRCRCIKMSLSRCRCLLMSFL